MRVGKATGMQIAFFTFALLLLAVPVSRGVTDFLGTSGHATAVVTKATPFAMFLVAMGLIAPFRRAVLRLLTVTIPARFRSEVAVVSVTSALLPFAFAVLLAFWVWAREGAPGVDGRIRVDVGSGMEKAFDPAGLVMYLVLVPIIGPIIEEVIFRGFLYRALERKWGWIAAMVLTSALFGLYHKHFYAAFISSIVFV
jgi:membrane protease YdiL (CAAX protease family)